MARCCTDFSRTDLLRRAAAQAGQGLPAIEPGMPLPAGTGLDRRSFLARSAGLALAVYGGTALVPRALEEGIAAAAAAGPQQVLVSVFLDGGADSLSMLFPSGDPLYRRYRPRLALPASSGVPFAEDDRLRWHPSLASLAQLHGEGKVSVMAGVGYSGPDQSHFTSRHFWEVGATSEQLRTGWLGRYLDRVGSADNPLQGLSLESRLQPALATARMPVASIDGPDRYSFWTRNVWGQVETRLHEAIGALGALPTGGDPALVQATSAARQAARLREQLLPFVPKDDDVPGYTSPVAYPKSEDDDFPRRLAGLAAMLGAGLPVRVVALTAPGMYDTHDDQPQELADGLKLTADSLLAFQRDLEARGLADRVLVHVWSEFGRRAKENGSNGTDHGAAGAGFLIGSRVNGRMIGEFPGLAKLDEHGNLRATADFRGVYSALLEQWLGADAEAIIPGARKFARPKVVR
jgi:uncharacterized protein (DUF1501 family)